MALHSKSAIEHHLADKKRRGYPWQLAIDKAAVGIEARFVSIARKVHTRARQFIRPIFPEQIMSTHAGTAVLSAARRVSAAGSPSPHRTWIERKQKMKHERSITTTESATSSEVQNLDPKRWWALACLLVGSFLALLDFFIVIVAMPSITSGLQATAADAQLIISSYSVVYAVFLITGGRLGDIYGRKSIFLISLAGFALASAFCGLAWSPSSLIMARLLQAMAAAAMAPQALASVHALFPPRERGRALSIYGITLGLSSAVGQLVGGALVAADIGGLSWRLIFLINVPMVVVAFIATLRVLRDTRSERRPRLDWGGVVLSCAALTAFVLPLVEGRERGWPVWSIVMLLTTPIFVEWFRRYEIRLAGAGGDPLIALEIFQQPGLMRGLGAIMTLYAISTFFLIYSIYLQAALGFTALQAGLGVIPFSIGFVTGSTFSPLFGRWLGRAATSFGYSLSATGAIAIALIASHFAAGVAPPWTLLGPAVVVVGLGMGMSMPTMMRTIVERVEPRHAGLVGGIVNSTLQVSAAVGIAVLGGLFYSVIGAHAVPATVTRAFSVTLVGIAICHVGGALLAVGLGQRKPRSPTGTVF
ncbi:MFS transporter [Bradyrhizobium japonicum]|uniref:MFS transporter n=1 Tax=Bradyrhizobium japonicum TaxID=375 RepID=UPI001BAA650F|nr:MFS transporter [Bradyrhizobium japonicum]MBR0750151.1 MFS transporter [Bradyrhizobium japonicum]